MLFVKVGFSFLSRRQLMPADVSFAFDMADTQDKLWIDRIMDYKRNRALGVPHDLVRRVKRTKVFRDFIEPLARAISAGQQYTAAQLAGMLGAGWTTGRVKSKLFVLGRPESRYGARIFDRPSSGHYSLTAAMKEALLNGTQ
jgi:hypothetical protein